MMLLLPSLAAVAVLTIIGLRRGAGGELGLQYRFKSGGALMTALTLGASVAGGWVFFGPVETGAEFGLIAVAGYALGQGAPVLLLAFLGPRLRSDDGAFRSPIESIARRTGAPFAVFTALIMIFYMVTFLSAELSGVGQVLTALDIGRPRLPMVLLALSALAYTLAGGLASSVRTDILQILIALPLAGWLFFALHSAAGVTTVELLSRGMQDPVGAGKLGLVFLIGITASNLFHQGYWQRVPLARSSRQVRIGFLTGGSISIGIILLFGMLGVIASASDAVESGIPSAALFSLIRTMLPSAIPLVLLLATMLIMSSLDTLLTGIAGAALSGLRAAGVHPPRSTAPILLTLITGVALAVAARGYSVLYLFLAADLVCSGAVLAFLAALFGPTLSVRYLAASAAIGIAAGLPFFPLPDFSSWSGLEPDLLTAFLLALAASGTVLAAAILREKRERRDG